MQVTTMQEARESNRATLNFREVAALLGVDQRTVSASAKAGDIPSIRMGRRVVIPRAKLLALLEPVSAAAEAETR